MQMEIKTCEEYVLAELKRLSDENEQLKKSPRESCRNVSKRLCDNAFCHKAQFECSECGCRVQHDLGDGVTIASGCYLVVNGGFVAFSYCPNCGRKIITHA